MQIAPGIDANKWKSLRLDDANSPDWQTAIDILRQRIEARFIEPVDFMIALEDSKSPSERRFGFAVLAIDCVLIETLASFIKGLEDTDRKSKPTFTEFLTSHPSFSSDFKTQEIADQFYDQFRCGILHQAEIGGASKVWSVGSMLRVDSGALVINRSAFHGAVKAAFQKYFADLQNAANDDLRQKFRKKMNFISRM